MENKEYTAKDITVLGGLEGVRKRPSMYVGSTATRGLHHLVFEVVDNSIDEAMVGECTEIHVTIEKNNYVTVEDNGRGIPVDIHPKLKKPAVEVILTKLHAGGKFDKKSYKVSGGLHGVGVSVVNALSDELEVWVSRDNKTHYQKFKFGKPVTKLKMMGKADKTGTKIKFHPDYGIFEKEDFQFDILVARLKELAFLNKGLRIKLIDKRKKIEKEFRYEGGIISFVENINKNKNAFHEPIYFKKEKNGLILEVALQYSNSFTESVFTFVNNVNTHEGGTHLAGFKTALTRTLNNYAEKNNIEKDIKLSSDDTREGLAAIISVKLADPQFEGQTKTKLGNSEVKGIVDSLVSTGLGTFLEENPKIGRLIIEKSINAAKARDAARKARELVRRKSALEGSTLPGKLADCSNKDPSKCEIYLVEGDSAGGCFSGDTKVALVDGRNLSFKELLEENKKGKRNYCYTIKKDRNIGISLIKNPRKTKKNTEVIKIILDNNVEIVCTPEHRFMTREESYVKAENLKKDLSLMPLNRKLSKIEGRITIKDYEMVYDPKNHKWIFTHILADKYNIKNSKYNSSLGDYKHHIDFNRLNNNPENIIRMTKKEHMSLHARMLEKTLLREDSMQKAREAHKKPEYREKISKIMSTPEMKKVLSARAKKQWDNEGYKEFMLKKFMDFYENNEEYREKSLERLNKSQKEYWSKEGNRKLQSERIKKYFEEHPEAKEKLKEVSKKQWDNPELKKWRSNKTKEQWTNEFREKRKKAYDKIYFKHTISFMKKILEDYGDLKKYDEKRVEVRNKNLLKKETFVERFFNNDKNAMVEAVKNHNHKIKKIEKLKQKIDVYDLEVEGTHNFALASGVFVHNSAKQGRNREFQAILPLKGKILNVEKARLNKILTSNEIITIITALGTSIGEEFDLSKLRYHKIIIMTDSDVDGSHITTLLLTFFYRYMNSLIENGNIYLALPPLYLIKKGKEKRYALNEREKNIILRKIGSQNIVIQRYKGLGEMNPRELWETTMDPEYRTLKKITIEDAVAADEMFTILMGDEVEPRRIFIQEHAKEVVNLDI